MADLIGQIVGPYQITERLGRGGMAEVYKAFHKDLEVYRAIKFIRPELGMSEDFRTRFLKEAQGVARLQHPNIVGIHDFGASEDRYYMVMEMVEGRSLKDILKKDGQMSIDRSVALVKAIAGALAYAHHQGLIHRDIKPDNIMVDTRGRPVLMDFGIAKLITSDAKITQTGHLIGTPAYMAPEQSKALDVGPPTDIYALSVVLFEMLTGHTPFEADTPMAVVLKSLSDPMPMPRSFNAKISEELQGVILKGTAKDMKDRYQSAMEFSAALDRAMDRIQATMDKTVVLPPPKPDVVPGSNRLALVVVLAVLFLGGALAAWIYLKPDVQDSAETDTSLAVETQSEPGAQTPKVKPGNDKTSETKKADFPKAEDSTLQPVTEPAIGVTEAQTQPSTPVVDTGTADSAVATRPVPIVGTPDPEKERLAEAARAEEDARVRAEADARVRAEADARVRAEADARSRAELVAEQKQKEETRRKAAQAAAAADAKNLVPRAKPAMVSIAGGSFSMGCGVPDTACLDAEKPVHTVKVKSFKLSKHEVTFDQYDAFAAATGRAKPDDKGWGRGNRPVINVNWDDAHAFVTWLAKETGDPYRLPTEAEWEYAARAGTSTVYLWGNEVGFGLANCTGCGSNFDGDRTSPVGTFAANKFGLHDVHGNVWEWVQDCWQEGYAGAPTDGSARLTGNCSSRILRGGSWLNNPSYLRIAYRNWLSSNLRDVNTGFRVARD
jgi:serine/threonine-protein kinase PpkA